MTFKTKDLNILAHSGGFSLWHLKTQDDAAAPGYLDRASGMVRDGDVIMAVQKGATTKILTVLENKNGKVTVDVMSSMGNLLPAAKHADVEQTAIGPANVPGGVLSMKAGTIPGELAEGIPLNPVAPIDAPPSPSRRSAKKVKLQPRK